ncbi:UDP-N-acetylmuramate:L-alanyl-gamma-D-glutamyl-meso-diaminopimelate ligase [Hydrogenophilus hirschii]
MHLHILGMGGVFMAGVAILAKALGYRVTGCDGPLYPPMSDVLAAHGLTPIEGYDADQIRLGADCYVVGNAISRGNPLLEAILDAGLPFVSGPQWLAETVLRGRWVIAVSGTHGKTTTTAMTAHILRTAGFNPGYLIGGAVPGFEAPAALGDSPFFVIEADEYDTAFSDKRAKFLHYRPRTLVINHLEYDHADIYPDLAAIETQFHHLIRTMPRSGAIFARAGIPAIDRVLARGVWSEVARFGLAESYLGGHNAQADDRVEVPRWQVQVAGDRAHYAFDGRAIGSVTLPLPGVHNALNGLAAVAAASHAGVLPEQAVAALASFPGVKRRLEKVGEAAGVTVFDDFAHHPTAIAATLDALRPRVTGRLIALFEPRSNTMKRGVMQAELPAAFARADRVFGYAKGLSWDLAAALAPLGAKAKVVTEIEALVAEIVVCVEPGDAVVVMSNGAFEGVQRTLLAALRAKERRVGV